ncbi:hypothetical protein M6D81_00065 [Paenibacillus sp. J5C_2022]|uniref:hypothetical protein n=1 Tax=Paenibacillus sp. J5C2022 TaxID=2977129 RepID=UPI0021D39DBC|nr:hypothetical protein [Paenibacillus sp. J5C2022]MCU6707084.1 hypothetical protein [Paenibacillus sp. J5C2022]
MNISQMMRGLLGDAVSGETRAMELKVGQVVRGVVMKLLDNNEAIVQINGVTIRAKLEMPLQAGQSAYLQVQPESRGSMVVLKGVDPGALGLADGALRDLVKLLGLPDGRWAEELVKGLRSEGIPFDRETGRAFRQAVTVMPGGMQHEQWIEAAAAAFKRGLPMTAGSIAAMHQLMFGQQLHTLLDTMRGQLLGLSQQQAQGTLQAALPAAGAETGQAAVTRLLTLLEGGEQLLRALGSSAAPGEGSVAAKGQGAALQMQPPGGGMREAAVQAPAAALNAMMADEGGGLSSSKPNPSGNWLGSMMKWLGVDHEHLLAKSVAMDQAGASSPRTADGAAAGSAARAGIAGAENQMSAGNGQVTRQEGANGGAAEAQQAGTRAQAAAGAASAASSASAGTIAAQAAGAEAPSQEAGGRPAPAQTPGSAPMQHAVAGERPLTEAVPQPAAGGAATSGMAAQEAQVPDTMKSALLQLIHATDIPATVKETAQQLLNQITGQQLLMTPERNSSVLSHVTMFIPIHDGDGRETASVHIQTRRGRRGELDADNCRLLFDLSMRTLGNMLVDVHVMDKIVSLNIWNDHPYMEGMLEEFRDDMGERIGAAGYQLLSLRTTPLPKEGDIAAEAPAKKKLQQPPDLAQFTSTRYRGVDLKV